MSKSILSFAQILRTLGPTTAVLAGTLLLSTPTHAGDTKPTAVEISKARAECAMQKQKVRALESANADEAQLSAANTAWEHACGHAQDLISAASGIAPPKPAADPNAAAQ